MAHIAITGGLSRLANSIVALLIERNHNVTILDSSTKSSAGYTRNVQIYECNLTKPHNFSNLIEKVTSSEYGPIEGLVQMARTPRMGGGLLRSYSLENYTEWLDAFNVQVIGPYFMATEIATSEANKGKLSSIVQISSILSTQVSEAESPAYHVAKSALDGATRVLAAALGNLSVRVNAISPGFIEDKIGGSPKSGATKVDNVLNSIRVMPGALSAVDVSKLVCFLLGPESNGITGQTIVIDKGLSVREHLDTAIMASKTTQP